MLQPSFTRLLARLLTTLLMGVLWLPAWAGANSCVNGVWHFDRDSSDNLEKLRASLIRSDTASETRRAEQRKAMSIPAFLFSDADLLIEKQDGVVVLKASKNKAGTGSAIAEMPSALPARSFSTAGQTKSVSLKNLNKGDNTVVASWEKRKLVVETTTAHGIYIEETFTLQDDGILQVLSRVSDGVSLRVNFSKFYQHDSTAIVDCLADQASTNNLPNS